MYREIRKRKDKIILDIGRSEHRRCDVNYHDIKPSMSMNIAFMTISPLSLSAPFYIPNSFQEVSCSPSLPNDIFQTCKGSEHTKVYGTSHT